MNALSKGFVIASAVAGLVSGGSLVAWATDAAESDYVRCAGVNECKGQGACGGASHDCAGKNECKGKGWVKAASAEECKEKGGEVVK
jgi:hypothetical protein